MRNAVLAFGVIACLAAPAAAGGLSPDVPSNHPALGSRTGRMSLCRIHLEKQGYPYNELHLERTGWSTGPLRVCTQALFERWRKLHRVG
jgi:hypothetical protein